MSKREGVRMELIHWLAKHDSAVERGEDKTSVTEMIDSLVSVLHSQGVVIKGQGLGVSHPHLANYFTVESLTKEEHQKPSHAPTVIGQVKELKEVDGGIEGKAELEPLTEGE